MKSIIKIILPAIILTLSLLFSVTPALASGPANAPEAAASLLAEVDSGMVLYSRYMDKKHPVDSLAKVMTLLLTVNACETGAVKKDEILEMTESAYYNINAMSTTCKILPGEEMSLLDLMYCAFVGNANEACNLLAERISGSPEAFITKMNAYADSLGCRNTKFINAHGQYNENQYSTAMDLFIIFREAMSHPLFVEISGTYKHAVESTNMSGPRTLVAENELINPNTKYFYPPCTAGKASATFEGGYSLVSFAEANGLTLIAVVLGSDTVYNEDESVDMRNLSESRKLYEWGFSQFSWRTVLSPDLPIANTPIMHGAGADYVNLRPESAIRLLLNNDVSTDEFVKTITIYHVEKGETLYAPVSAGDVLGEVVLSRKGEKYGPVLLIANTDVELHRVQYIRMQINEILHSKAARITMWSLIVIVLGYVALVIRYNVVRRKRLRLIKEAKRKLREERRDDSF